MRNFKNMAEAPGSGDSIKFTTGAIHCVVCTDL